MARANKNRLRPPWRYRLLTYQFLIGFVGRFLVWLLFRNRRDWCFVGNGSSVQVQYAIIHFECLIIVATWTVLIIVQANILCEFVPYWYRAIFEYINCSNLKIKLKKSPRIVWSIISMILIECFVMWIRFLSSTFDYKIDPSKRYK